MRKSGTSWLDKPIMEGYTQYLIENKKTPPYKAKMYIDLIRRFHNHVGRSYADITKRDVLDYLFHLGEKEKFKDRSLYIHLTAIRKFYEFLTGRGEVVKLPTDGLTVKDWDKCRTANRLCRENTGAG